MGNGMSVEEDVSAKKMTDDTYEKLYEKHAEVEGTFSSVGAGDFEHVGKIEKSIMQTEGLKPDSTLLDFGCGVGRLAVHIIPELSKGRYIGVDISKTMLENANRLVNERCKDIKCEIKWIQQQGYSFNVPEKSVDLICAFSVFTHMEHEDAFKYLVEAKKIIKDGGKFIFSCLPIHLDNSKAIFFGEAAFDFGARWSKVRSFVTSIEMMENIARMAKWEVMKWIPAETPSVFIDGSVGPYSLGQSVCVLKKLQ